MYRCEVWLKWRQHDKNNEIGKKRQEFVGVDQADVYNYIKYYTLKFGMCDVEMIEEGEV
jgi:hypothetical protein